MKTHLLPLASVLAMSAALLLASAGVIAAGIAFTVAGVLAIFAMDYSRTLPPVSLPAEILPFNPRGRAIQEMRAAA
jgi:heme/copper-type cytochrome/quinol oxidase subunit 2